MNSNERGEFDFGKDVIYISQITRCPLTVAAMREGIKLGWKAKDVEVSKNEDGSYTILEGNHRTSAHFLEKKSLGYVVLGEFGNCIVKSYNVKDEIRGDVEYQRLANSLIYLPRNVAEAFCEKNRQGDFFKYLDSISAQVEGCRW
ncbi:hypothetical protein J4226_00890 [Candidatus Pacearchaeota archaeon]|nr:hypothetical protein [Candidatus Pacearchaeota archaeon]